MKHQNMSMSKCVWICDIKFHIVVEAFKKDHLDLIQITKKQSEIIQRCQVKEKFDANMSIE